MNLQHEHQTAAYLMKANNFLPDEPQYMCIRSNLVAKCAEQLKQSNFNLNRCTVCGVNFQEVPPRQQIKSVPTLNRFLRRHLRDNYYKTKYQAVRMKKFNRKLHNRQKIVNICRMCNKKMTTKLTKPPNIITTKALDRVSRKQNNLVKKRLKRLQKKKKNREFAGLNESVVRSVTNDLKNNDPSTSVICLNDTLSPKKSSVSTTTTMLNSSPIKISDTDSPICSPKPAFFIDTIPSSANKIKKLTKKGEAKSYKFLNPDIAPIAPSRPGPTNTANISQPNANNQKSNLNKKQRKLLKKSKNVNLNSSVVINTPKTPQTTTKRKKKANRILAQPMKKDKKNQRLNSLASLLKNNDSGATVKSTSMLTEFLKSVS